jgi:hypothetical protein
MIGWLLPARQGGNRDQPESEPEPEPEPEPANGGGGEELIFCTFHHLLAGKSHTKEQEIVGAAKSLGYTGLIVYGTPGVVVLYRRRDQADEREFLNASRKIGKKVGERESERARESKAPRCMRHVVLCLALFCCIVL